MKLQWEIFKKYFNKRKSNYAFWLSLISAVMIFLISLGLSINNYAIMNIAKAILGILVVLGIVNDPTTNNPGYTDDKNL